MDRLLIVGQMPTPPGRYDGLPREGWPIFRKLDEWFTAAGFPGGYAAAAPFMNVCGRWVGLRYPTVEEMGPYLAAIDRHIREERPYVVVTLGRAAADRFLAGRGRKHDFLADAGNAYGCERAGHPFHLVPLPHPSGRNRLFNEPAGHEAAARSMGAVAALLRPPRVEMRARATLRRAGECASA